MNPKLRRIAVFVGAAALASATGIGVGIGVGVRAQGDSSPAGSDRAAALASELGLSADKVRSALRAVRPAGGGPPSGAPGGTASPPSTSVS
jgi:hypothetical protein